MKPQFVRGNGGHTVRCLYTPTKTQVLQKRTIFNSLFHTFPSRLLANTHIWVKVLRIIWREYNSSVAKATAFPCFELHPVKPTGSQRASKQKPNYTITPEWSSANSSGFAICPNSPRKATAAGAFLRSIQWETVGAVNHLPVLRHFQARERGFGRRCFFGGGGVSQGLGGTTQCRRVCRALIFCLYNRRLWSTETSRIVLVCKECMACGRSMTSVHYSHNFIGAEILIRHMSKIYIFSMIKNTSQKEFTWDDQQKRKRRLEFL